MLRSSLYTAICALLCHFSALAQTAIGVKGSLQFANETLSGSGITINADNIIGFQAGLMLKAPITDKLSLRPQLLYSVKGLKISGGLVGAGNEAKGIINYIEVPVQLAYSIELGEGNLVLGAGPYLAYGLNGQSTTTIGGKTQTEKLDFSSSDAQKRFDFGGMFSAGYELTSGLGISAYYAPGLANLSASNVSSTLTTRSTSFGFSVGYFFGQQ